jgi:hypothetical protein
VVAQIRVGEIPFGRGREEQEKVARQ